MFATANFYNIASLSTKLCSQAEQLRTRLQENIDNDDLSSAIEIATESIGNDCIVALLAMVQCVDRDPENDFRPSIIAHDDNDDNATHYQALNNMADVALLTLTDLYKVGELYLKSKGWVAIDQSSTVSGGIIYECNETGEVSEEPNYDNLNWQMKLMLSIPILIEPGCDDVDGHVVWAATVVYYQHHGDSMVDTEFEQLCKYNLECHDSSCISVIDVLKSDEDGGQSARLRGTYTGCWYGLYAEALGELDMKHSIGQVLESWTETTLAGLSTTNKQSSSSSPSSSYNDTRILVFGLGGCGNLVSFLQNHVMNVELTVIEPSKSMVDIAVKYYQFTHVDCVTIVDPVEYVKSGQRGGKFDTIIVNICSRDDTFPEEIMNGDFFNGLVEMLSNHPTATLLVNSGASVDAVSLLVNDALDIHGGHRSSGNMLVLREYLLREHTISDNEGVIVAARRREWSLSVEEWQREHNGENAQLSGSMDVSSAQQTEVVLLEKFLSNEEIESIHKVAKAELASIGKATEGTALTAHSDSWKVLYLQHNGLFQQKLSTLRQRILEAVRKVDQDNWCLFDKVNHVNIRVVEYHQNEVHHELGDPKHYDLNSLVTMDLMLSEDGAFEGGDLQTLEADGTLKKYEFKQGDALVFASHKYHCVDRVRSGRRNVMVLEFWYGPERQCPHRCEHFGTELCNRDPAQHLYTQQYSKQSDDLKEQSTSSIPLPFRLGSVSICNNESRETLELLWEPCGSTEVVTNKPASSVSKEQPKDEASSGDPFACFGSDSDAEDDGGTGSRLEDKASSDPFACFGSDSDSDKDSS